MIRSFRSEWRKLLRPGLLAGAGGAMVGFSTLATLLIFRRSTAPVGRGRLGARLRITPAQLAQADGLVHGFRASAQLMGIVTLVVFASAVASEYSLGTLRSLLVRQPSRARLLAGKLAALACFALVAVAVACAISCAVSFPLASGHHIATAAWTTGDGVRAVLAQYGNVAAAMLGWAAIGAVLALVLRASGPAVGAALGWVVAGEAIVAANWDGSAAWLPGRAIEALAAGGGNTDLSYHRAAVMAAVYTVALLAGSFVLFDRRDVVS